MKFVFGLFLCFFLALTPVVDAQVVSKISFVGITKTKRSSLQKIIDCQVGIRVDSSMLKHDVDKLSRLPGIASAYFQLENESNESSEVTFVLEENFSLIPLFNLWNADSILAYQIGAYDVNFLGRNVTIGGYYQYNGLNSFGINLAAPYLFEGKFGLEMNLQRWASYEPLYFEQHRVVYQFHYNSNEMLLLYKMNARNSLKAGVSVFREMYTRYEHFQDENAIVFPENVDLNKGLFKLEYEFNDVNYFYYLLDGFKNSFHFQTVKTQGLNETPFVMAWNDMVWYKRNDAEGNLAMRLRLGLATNNFSPFAPFAVDNQKNIRGVGVITRRGTGALVFNVEYRNTLLMKKWFRLQGNAFVDVGSFRVPGSSLDSFAMINNVDIHAGLGLRFIHKTIYNAVFRIDYGIGLTKENSNGFVIGIGQYF